MKKTYVAPIALTLSSIFSCDSGVLQTKALMTDSRSGLRAADIKSSDVSVDTAAAITNTEFKITIQGNLPTSGSGAGKYQLLVIGAVADIYHYAVMKNSTTCEFDETVAGTPLAIPINFEVHEQAAYRLCIRAYTVAGEPSEIFTHNWSVDLKKPDIALLNVPTEPSGQVKLNFTVLSEKAAAYKFALNNGDKNCVDEKYSDEIPISEPIAVDSGIPGNKRICAKAVDSFGLESDVVEKNWIYSDKIPEMALEGLPTPVATLNEIAISFGQDSKIETYQYTVLHGSADCSSAVFGGQLPVTTPISSNLALPGINTICIKGKDSAGKATGIFSYSWKFDILKKDLVITGLPEFEDPAEKLAVAVSGTDIKEYKYALIHADNALCGNVNYSAYQPVATSITDKLDLGGYSLCIVGKNAAGTTGSPTIHNWTRIKMPSVTIEAISGIPSGVTNKTIFNGVRTGGLNAEKVRFGSLIGNVDCAEVIMSAPVLVSTLLDIDLGAAATDGSYTVCLSGIGHFNQISSPKKYPISVDKTPALFQLDNVPTGIITTTVIAIDVISNAAVEYVFVHKPGITTCNPTPESTTKFPLVTPLISLSIEGDQTLCVWVFDSAGNFSPPTLASWKLDTTAPVISKIFQENNTAATAALHITLANVESSGATYRYYTKTTPSGNALGCEPASSNAYNGGPINITVLEPFNRPGSNNDVRRVCIVVEDAAGNKSTPKSTDIYK